MEGGAGLLPGREAGRGTGREVGVQGTPANVEQMSFAQEKGLSLRSSTPLEPHELRPLTSPPTKDPIWYRKMSEGLG